MGSLIWTIVIGFVVGLVARALKPGNDSLGIVMTSILGIVGAYAASFVGKTMGWYADGEAAGFIAAVIGAVVLLFIVGMIKKK
ncbi:GlsB/YeaQ/YmgE family stress response membrane protein [Arenimonas sp. GDDSR-1]|uniref:GlsB/YeaQ/YmgE family stress response membrane protein n=1 Tax=Arenimonas sp. GDDSR-1 TaxID=2950125 RepID=UPI00261DEA04|nr:GlsB/YeaQ/YmgE family stress response membrane protein [Arenimonas sp. GDDSR-1]